jgi:hypothetical protein
MDGASDLHEVQSVMLQRCNISFGAETKNLASRVKIHIGTES